MASPEPAIALPLCPRLAFPFTCLVESGSVTLVAGEDYRYTLSAPGLDTWLPDWLPFLDGRRTLDEVLARLDSSLHPLAIRLLERFLGERILLEGLPDPLVSSVGPILIHGQGTARAILETILPTVSAGSPLLHVLVQDSLDYEEALRFNERCLTQETPWLWISWGAMSRGYVSPVFLPHAGPCLACLLSHFEYLSPAPEIYAALRAHATKGGAFTSAPFPTQAVAILAHLALWKAEVLRLPQAPSAVYQLHVLEVSSLELTSHRVFIDPECGACRCHR